MEEKHFDEWNEVKKKIHFVAQKLDYHEREIWWYAAGENIGIEINGKGSDFARPVLIIRKYGPDGFFGVPLSSKIHEGIWYDKFYFRNREQCALLSQARNMSAYRLYRKIGRLPMADYMRVCDKFKELIFKNNTPNS